ncbi:hypothetical protein BC940DRAFT_312671 [Gongronella butleri]|nr:hypothetical protein BC940DRAFT_312671 [Gongronella butleri]
MLFPPEILDLICECLRVKDLLTARLVNTTMRDIATRLVARHADIVFDNNEKLRLFLDHFESPGISPPPFQRVIFDCPAKPSMFLRLCRALPSCHSLNFLPCLKVFHYESFGNLDESPITDVALLPRQLTHLTLGDIQRGGDLNVFEKILDHLPALESLNAHFLRGRMDGQHLVQYTQDRGTPSRLRRLRQLQMTIDDYGDGDPLFPFVLLVYLLTSLRLDKLIVTVCYADRQRDLHSQILPPVSASLVMALPANLSFELNGVYRYYLDPEEHDLLDPWFSNLSLEGSIKNLTMDPPILRPLLKFWPLSNVHAINAQGDGFDEIDEDWCNMLVPLMERAPLLTKLTLYEEIFEKDTFVEWEREHKSFVLERLDVFQLQSDRLSSLERLALACPKLSHVSISFLYTVKVPYIPVSIENTLMQPMLLLFAMTALWVSLPVHGLVLQYELHGGDNNMLHLVLENTQPGQPRLKAFIYAEPDLIEPLPSIVAQWLEKQIWRWVDARLQDNTAPLAAPDTFPSELAEDAWNHINDGKVAIVSCKSLSNLKSL